MFANSNNMSEVFYDLPLWLQVYTQIEKEPYIRGLLRKTAKGLNDNRLIIKDDIDYANSQQRISWYRIFKDFVLIADNSDEGNRIYNYYYMMFESSRLFIKTKLLRKG